MSWFDEQIKTRIHNDTEAFENAFEELSSAILGKRAITSVLNDDRVKTQNAIEEILKFYHVKPLKLPSQLRDMNEQLECLLRPAGIMRRVVKLKGNWYKDGIGPLLGQTQNGDTVAILPKGLTGYEFFDWTSGDKIKVTKTTAAMLKEEAICFYKPLPLRKLSMIDLLKYIIEALSISDYLMVGSATLAVTLLGLLTPFVNKLIFDKVIPSGKIDVLFSVACLLLGVTISSMLINITKSLVMSRIQTKMNIAVQAASMARVLSLPADFFKNYSAGELSSRAQSINNLCNMLSDAVFTTGLSSIFSLIYISQILNYTPALVAPALTIIGITLAASLLSTFCQIDISRKRMNQSAKLAGLIFSLFSGIQKIKLAGAEHRAFSKWAESYKEEASLTYNPPMFIKITPILSSAITAIGAIVIYYFAAAAANVSIADYMAFSVSYGMVSTAMLSLISIADTVADIKPVFEMVEPILKTVPEMSAGKQVLTKLSGTIELNNVSFKYSEDTPNIIDNLSLKIRAGQYVAIVGATGCGKSTLMRMLLGFEKPQKGAIYYDGKDLDKIDLKSLRQHIGVVMQNGKLFSGDIFSNITISAPWLSLEEAWEAAELAGIAEDIRDMPMGMHTVISEGSGGISGGQRQRLMIARAIAPKPKVLMFDEATSALDNITQKKVSEALDKFKSTRIVIAHRLSTIRQCDRILVLEKGKIIEDGNYEELIKKNGSFAQLVQRQRLDNTENIKMN